MTMATYITLFRLLSAVLMFPLIYLNNGIAYIIAAVIFSVAIASDILDGFVARKFGQITELGATLDPLVDKILIYTVLFSLLQVGVIEPILLFPMFIRDMMVDGLRSRAAETSGVIGANIWGKAKFGFQALSIMCSLAFCITGRPEFAAGANAALLVALVISIPGLVVVASMTARIPRRRAAPVVAR